MWITKLTTRVTFSVLAPALRMRKLLFCCCCCYKQGSKSSMRVSMIYIIVEYIYQ